MSHDQPRIADLFRIPGRYLRSAHLEYDFDDIDSLKDYVLTPPMVAVLARVIDGLRPSSGRRSWRITGDYGSGKSSFALMLAHLLRDSAAVNLAPIREAVERYTGRDFVDFVKAPMIPVLVTGDREPIVSAIARAVALTVKRLRSGNLRGLGPLLKRSAEVEESGEITQLLELLDHLRRFGDRNGFSGVLLVIDELGKFLEYAALQPESEDVYVLQRLGELAARSVDSPLVVLGLLHQGFLCLLGASSFGRSPRVGESCGSIRGNYVRPTTHPHGYARRWRVEYQRHLDTQRIQKKRLRLFKVRPCPQVGTVPWMIVQWS